MAKNPIYQQIKNYLETLIRQNKDSADFRLPSENQLANKFGASRICAKEAYRELEEEHLVRRVQGKGTFINTERSGSLACEKWISVIFPLVDSTFLHKILGGILDFYKETEYSVFVQYSNQNPELESRQIKAATYNNASGILIYPIDNESYSMELLKLCLNQYPTIVIDRFLPGLTLPLVSSDHYQSAYALTGKMLEMGCRKIFFFVPQAERLTSIATRCSGYEAALRDKKLFPRYQFIDNYADYGEFQCMFLEHFESYPDTDGVIVQSGYPEKVLYEVLEERGLLGKILVGVYDSNLPSYLNPLSKIAHVRVTQNAYQIGRAAAQAMYERLNFNKPLESITIPFQVDACEPGRG